MSSKHLGPEDLPDERHFPPGTLPGAVGAIGALAAVVLVLGLIFGALLGFCHRPEPVQMIPTPAASSAAIASSSAQVTATQSVRVTIRTANSSQKHADNGNEGSTLKSSVYRHGHDFYPPQSATLSDDQGEEIVIEVSQAIATTATSSAQASASVDHFRGVTKMVPDHGRLGVALLTMPGVLAADLQLYRLDVSPVTRPLVNVDMEVGLDVAGNLEAGAAGVSIGSKAFAVGGAWSRWNLSEQGLFLGAGLRF